MRVRGSEHGLASRSTAHRTLPSERMRKGAPHTLSFALIAVLILLAACTSPAATPGRPTQTQTAAPVPTVAPPPAPHSPCWDPGPLTGEPTKHGPPRKP